MILEINKPNILTKLYYKLYRTRKVELQGSFLRIRIRIQMTQKDRSRNTGFDRIGLPLITVLFSRPAACIPALSVEKVISI